MSIEIVKPVIAENGIEFYVSSDGSEVGVSIRGLARLCGTSVSSISEVFGKNPTDSMKTLLGEDYKCSAISGVNNAKIVNSKAATKLIRYYAYDSKFNNDTAKFSLGKFLDIGFNTWVKQVTGFSVADNNHMLTATINELFRNMQVLTQEMREWRTVRRVADDHMEGVNILIEEINKNEEHKQPEIDERTYTISEWLESEKGVTDLPIGESIKIGRAVAQTYKSLRQYKPQQVRRMYRSRKKNYMMPKVTAGYTQEDFPILEVAYNEYLLR